MIPRRKATMKVRRSSWVSVSSSSSSALWFEAVVEVLAEEEGVRRAVGDRLDSFASIG
jgi:hypothetical protein